MRDIDTVSVRPQAALLRTSPIRAAVGVGRGHRGCEPRQRPDPSLIGVAGAMRENDTGVQRRYPTLSRRERVGFVARNPASR
jgi:hypothetical protein